ncbi:MULTISPECIES: hypothetical protein [Brucella/Ochrobactrum group]|uniref:hypothetical protein n=1 Tax=Brucella/Ochrobactrum group TaxID=2826938 RepID=UPI000D70619B|nr:MULTISPECIES: hypothetical protein [Brucella/Ochrobactrum group]MCH4539281.1 hypothetical protein [Ochrobactrum sp. A-1]PWU70675.1 hypothetical protein DK867_23485 [Ochrobactrum sp. POC9]
MPLNKSLVITPEMKQADAIAAIVNSYRAAIQSMIDRTANERQYDDGNSLASYVNSTVPEWAAEAQAFVVWRDQIWTYSLGELEKVKSGQREQPSSGDFLAELPAFEWPE